MGGRGRSRTQRKHFKQNRENVWKFSKSDSSQQPSNANDSGDSVNPSPSWEPFSTQNTAFETYYKEQGIVDPEEWDSFVESLRKPLPAAFRINSSSQFWVDVRSELEADFVKSLQSEFTGADEAEAIRPLPWYPQNLAWHSNFSRNQLRKNQTLERFHEFLKLAHEVGNITRQEAVSMVPPLFLDVHPDHFVLDMCAAPGSKTFQLLEIIHKSNEPGSLPSGMVVANDVDVQRSNLLIHQTKRMCTANLIVTNHEAQHFPGCNLNKFRHKANDMETLNGLSISQLLFDRVLCDVPCSGDGTLRKAPDLWRKWNAGMGNGLHGLQLKIAIRGISLLKVGGRMVYSTCSMNPVENEAVVAEVLRRCGDSVELVDVSSELPQLVRRPGLRKWKVRDKGIWLSSHKDVPESRRSIIHASMFPSGSGSGLQPVPDESLESPQAPDEDVSSFPLERCMRIVPQDQNTGAFFIAIFHKRSPFPARQEKSDDQNGDMQNNDGQMPKAVSNEVTKSNCESDANATDGGEKRSSITTPGAELAACERKATALDNENGLEGQQTLNNDMAGQERVGAKRKLQMQGRWIGVDPVILFKDETVISSIKAFYGIDDSFPLHGHLVTRNNDTDHVKRIYYISKSVKDVLELNLQAGQQLKIASVGLKMFERQTSKDGNSSPCRFRISSEGLPLLLPFITKQILHASPADFKHLLQYKSIKFADFVDSEFGEKASKLELGCCVVILREEGQGLLDPMKVNTSTIAIGCWKGRANLNVMVTAIDCQDLLDRLVKRMGTEDCSSKEMKPSGDALNGIEAIADAETKDEKETVNLVEV